MGACIKTKNQTKPSFIFTISESSPAAEDGPRQTMVFDPASRNKARARTRAREAAAAAEDIAAGGGRPRRAASRSRLMMGVIREE